MNQMPSTPAAQPAEPTLADKIKALDDQIEEAHMTGGDPAEMKELDTRFAVVVPEAEEDFVIQDAQVKAYEQYTKDTPLREAIAAKVEQVRVADVALINRFNNDINFRIETRTNDLVRSAKSQANSLVDLYKTIIDKPIGEDKDKRIKVLAGASVIGNGIGSVRRLAMDFAQPDPSKPVNEVDFEKVLAREKSRHISAIKSFASDQGLDSAVIDILASDDDEETKFKKIKRII